MKSIPLSGVYVITNTSNGHKYIGSAVNLNARRKLHFSSLAKGKHHNIYLQRAYNKYGDECFVFSVLSYCPRSKLIELEQQAIDTYKPEYNIAPRAGSQLGYRHTDSSRQKMGAKSKGRTFTEAFKEKMRTLFTGKQRPDDVRKKISEANKGRVIGKEWREKLSLSHKGNKHTPEQIEKIRAVHIGRKNTPETIEKMRQSARRRVARQRGESVE